jgi:hypothetical protein
VVGLADPPGRVQAVDLHRGDARLKFLSYLNRNGAR